jgi:hypothetical protein
MGEVSPSGLEVRNYSRGVFEETVGRLQALPGNILLGTPKAIWQKVPDIAEYLQDKFKDVPWQGNVEVHLNRSPLFRQLRRLFQKERRSNLFFRVVAGLPTTLSTWLAGKFARADAYNPYTETAQVFHSDSAVAMHEVGHAKDFDQARNPSLKALARYIPFVANVQEWKASRNAMQHLDPQERDKAKKVLEPAFGSYCGTPFAILAPIVRWMRPASIIATVAGIVGGHIHSRVGKKNIFYNEPPKTEVPAAAPTVEKLPSP